MIGTGLKHGGGSRLPLLLLFLGLLAGCDVVPAPDLVAVTAWTPARIAAFESELKASQEYLNIRWIRVGPTDPVDAVAVGADLALGVPPSVLAGLAYGEAVELGRLPLGFSVEPREGETLRTPSAWPDLADPSLFGRVILDDPRRDWTLFEAESAGLAGSDWAAGYASLVRAAGNSREQSAGGIRPSTGFDGPIGESGVFRSLEGRPVSVEQAAVLTDAPRAEAARKLIARLVADGSARASAKPTASASDRLRAELLGATLHDCRDELRTAVEALATMTDATKRARLIGFLTEAPPWPPASVQMIRERPNGPELLDTLATQVMPDRPVREWLLARWREPGKPIDGSVLELLATALEGKLAREPRFRAWLRAEWRAWAAQRYRRVARVANGASFP